MKKLLLVFIIVLEQNFIMMGQSSWDVNNNPLNGGVTYCTAFGFETIYNGGYANSCSAYYCTCAGYHSIYVGDNANECVALGSNALYSAGSNVSDPAYYNIGIGAFSLYSTDVGDYNTAAGHSALYTNTDGSYNTAAGSSALYSNTSGIYNTAIGFKALHDNSSNLSAVVNGSNTATGYKALYFNKESQNTAFGSQALYSNTYGEMNTAFGFQALYYNSASPYSTGSENTAVGHQALYTNSNGSYNTAGGLGALFSNQGGALNTAIGATALYSNSTGDNNVGIGAAALYLNSTGDGNVGIGGSALYNNQAASFNTGIGQCALYYSSNSAASYNTAIGFYAYNAVGYSNTGSDNTVAGAYADLNGSYSNCSALGAGAIVSASNKVRLGNTAVTAIVGTPANWTVYSDGRFKSRIDANEIKGIEFIKLLRPVVYNFDCKKFQRFLLNNAPDSIVNVHMKVDYSLASKQRRSGFIAQEVENAAMKCGYDFGGLNTPQNENDNYSLTYAMFVVPLVKAVQEQQKLVEDQKQTSSVIEFESNEQDRLLSQLVNQRNSINGLSNLSQLESQYQLDAQPNPFKDETIIKYTLPIQTREAFIIISTLSGNQIFSYRCSGNGASQLIINSDKMSAGIYIYSIVADGRTVVSKRLVVEGK